MSSGLFRGILHNTARSISRGPVPEVLFLERTSSYENKQEDNLFPARELMTITLTHPAPFNILACDGVPEENISTVRLQECKSSFGTLQSFFLALFFSEKILKCHP